MSANTTTPPVRHLRLVEPLVEPLVEQPVERRVNHVVDDGVDNGVDKNVHDGVDTADAPGPGSASTRIRDLTQLPPPARAMRRQVLANALAVGSPLDADAVSLVLAAKLRNHGVPLDMFTEDIVWQLLWLDVFDWCAARNQTVPEGMAEVLWQMLDHLVATVGLHPDSDPLTILREPLRSCGGLGPTGQSRKPLTGSRRRNSGGTAGAKPGRKPTGRQNA